MNSNVPVSPVRLDPVPEAPTYPATRLGWLHQFFGLLVRAEVAREIGRDAMLLILAIAVQEDALKYGSAPILFDTELQRLTGIRSRQHLDRIRQKAVDAGWLVVVRNPDADQTVAQYWTLIPKRLNVFDRPANVGVVSDTAEAPHSPDACGKDVNSEPAVASRASTVQNAGMPSPLQPSAGSCQPDALSPRVAPLAGAELEARSNSAGSPLAPSPACLATTGTSDTPAARPAVPERLGNTTAAGASAELAATRRDQGVSTVAPGVTAQPGVTTQAAATTQATTTPTATAPTPSQPMTVTAVLKRLSEYPLQIRQQAGDLLTVYPSLRDPEQGLLSICRALEKIPYSQLRPLVNRYIVARDRPGQDCRLTPSAATWFDEERWREGPQIWEVRDRDLVKKA